jgi:hypothetical protein
VDTYQLTLLHKDFPDPLNVVIVVKTDRRTHRRGHVVLFSTDLTLTGLQLVDYYSLRFQIEFNFRDARQYWGLEDFMYVSPRAVTNAVNLAFLMVNLSSLLMRPFRQRQPQFSILDLKAHYRAQRYLHETIKLVPGSPDPSFLSELARKVLSLGAIHASQHFQAAACLAQVLSYRFSAIREICTFFCKVCKATFRWLRNITPYHALSAPSSQDVVVADHRAHQRRGRGYKPDPNKCQYKSTAPSLCQKTYATMRNYTLSAVAQGATDVYQE